MCLMGKYLQRKILMGYWARISFYQKKHFWFSTWTIDFPPEDYEKKRKLTIVEGEERLSVPVIFFISSTEAVCGTLSASTGFITTCSFRGSSWWNKKLF